MSISRVMISGSDLIDQIGGWYTFDINPIEFDNQYSSETKYGRTLGGKSFEFLPQFDGRPRTMEWRNLGNKEPYITLIANLESLVGQNTYIKLRDLSGTLSNDQETAIRVTNLSKEITRGAGSNIAALKWSTVKLEYVLI